MRDKNFRLVSLGFAICTPTGDVLFDEKTPSADQRDTNGSIKLLFTGKLKLLIRAE